MKISIETVKAHLHQARKRLIEKLGDVPPGKGRKAGKHGKDETPGIRTRSWDFWPRTAVSGAIRTTIQAWRH